VADAAAKRVVELRALHDDGRAALAQLVSTRSENLFELLSAGFAGMLLGATDGLETMRRAAERTAGSTTPWIAEVGDDAREAIRLHADATALLAWLERRIAGTREVLKLEPLDRDHVVEAWQRG
jgi:hypothetical protein